MPPTIKSALFHQSASDMSCQVKWSGEGYATADPGPAIPYKFVATGRALVEVVDKATNKVLRTVAGEFTPFTASIGVPTVDGREYIHRVGRPGGLAGFTVPAGQTVRLVSVFYAAVFIGDLLNGTGALMGVDPDPGYPPQIPI